jgi:deoxyribodipyrimidine photo-lyase
MNEYTLFIFRRDLRLTDNNGLIYAIQNCDKIIPIFIFTPEQITDKNKYKSNNAIQFMCESLKELNNELKNKGSKLHIFYGDNIKVLKKIIKTINISSIIFNMDYTPYALNRDKSIQELCEEKDIECSIIEDYLLAPIGELNKSNGDPYTIFTPFKNNGLKYKVDKPSGVNIKNLTRTNKLDEYGMIDYETNPNILVNGGRKNGLKYLQKIKNQENYNKTRNTINTQTTHLSAYIKFGCISIREVYWKIIDELGKKNDLLGQIFWREFYFYIAYYFPYVLKNQNFNKKYDRIKWKWSKKNYDAWCNGETGYPVVDAGMRELNKTGFMHNRARLITSNFLNRILGIDWRWSELYYAKMLTDYDPAVNSGNHQWIASVGVDPKPYFQRLFNPWLQSERFDPDGKYIKKWIPELKNIEPKDIHNWNDIHNKYDLKKIKYFKPIVDYKKGREDSIKMYREALK